MTQILVTKPNRKVSMKLIDAKTISNIELEEMFSIYSPHHNMKREKFLKRIGTFDKLALYKDRERSNIVGFLGINIREFILSNGKKTYTYYYGSMFIEEQYRGNNLVGKTGFALVLKLMLTKPFSPIFAWGDAISYKSYLMLVKNYAKIYPSVKHPMVPKMKEIQNFLGKFYYGKNYDEKTGCVMKEENRLKDHITQLSNRELEDENIRFYSEVNPNYSKGYGLICLVPATLQNICYNFFRTIGKKIKKIFTRN